MTDETYSYLEDRWKNQKEYYSKHSSINKTWHERLQMITMGGSALVPVLIIIEVPLLKEYAPIVLSLIVTVTTGLERIKKYGERWRAFRLASEALKRERALYEANAGRYRRSTDPARLFAERCEDIIAAEVGMYFPDAVDEGHENQVDKNQPQHEHSENAMNK